jgi:hypothetical protein
VLGWFASVTMLTVCSSLCTCRSYILAYNSHALKEIFNVHTLDLQVGWLVGPALHAIHFVLMRTWQAHACQPVGHLLTQRSSSCTCDKHT